MKHLGPLLLLVALAPVFALSAAPPAVAEWDVDGLEELLPHHATEAERLRWLGRENEMPDRGRVSDPPPLAPVRNCAEWEPCTGVLIRYPLGLPYNLLRDFDDDVVLHVVVSSSSQSAAQNNLSANGVDMAQVEFLVRPNDSIWTRDYGPWFVFDGNDDITIIDHTYNRPYRPNDNLIPVYFGDQQDIPVVSHDMYHAGGNYMTDGANISSSTRLVYNEAASHNGMSPAQVDELMADYYGVETYHVLDYIESGGIHHIDTWAKFLDEETVLVKEVWTSHHTYTNLEQRAVLLASLQSSTGRNYQVDRVYCYSTSSGPASYTNSLILNDSIYIPFFGNASYDAAAIAAYEQAAPGYTVRGYYYSGFLSDDALHCRAKGAMDRDMLRVSHIPIVEEQEGPVSIEAFLHDHSDAGVSAVELHYRQDGGSWLTVAMTLADGDIYQGVIAEPAMTADTDYYIHAESVSGRTEGMPRVEPNHWYTFHHVHSSTGVGGEVPAAGRAVLHPSAPNPFAAGTTFSFELKYAEQVELAVFDAQGRFVRRLVDDVRPAGVHEILWDGRDAAGRPVPTGIYYYRLRTAGIEYSRPALRIQ